MTKPKDVPGNTIASQLAFDEAMVKRGILLGRCDDYIDKYAENEVYISGLSVRVPQDVGDEYLLVVRAMVAGEASVAFHSSATFHEVVLGFIRRLQNRSLRWKDDEYS